MRRESWRRGLHTYPPIAEAQPNAAHLAIADWWRAGLVSGVVTQNIDGLHQRAACLRKPLSSCTATRTASVVCRVDSVSTVRRSTPASSAGDEDPACPGCGGILKTTTISFGQGYLKAPWPRLSGLHANARLCLVIGSSLVVTPAAMLPEVTLDAGGRLVIVNLTPTHLDHLAVLVAREPAAVLLAQVQGLLRAARQH